MKITLVGSRDRQLEEMLRAAGATVSPAASLSDVAAGAGASQVPPVVVIDVRDQPSLPAGLAGLRQASPAMGIIVVASSLDPAMMLEAMRAGANEFLADPLAADDLRAAIGRVSSLQKVSKPGALHVFLGAKGGVGTTTIAVNVATALARARAGRVLLIDLHPAYGDAALFFGVEPRFSVLDALENTHRLDESYLRSLVAHTKSGVDLLASSDRATAAPIDARRVRALLDFVARSYDHVVLDAPRSESGFFDAFDGAASVVIVANQELPTVRGAARMATTLRQRYGKDRLTIVVTRYDTGAEIGPTDIERATGGSVRHLFPSDYRLAVEALNRGQPLVVENHSKLGASLSGFARSLVGVSATAGDDAPKPGSLLGRLMGRR